MSTCTRVHSRAPEPMSGPTGTLGAWTRERITRLAELIDAHDWEALPSVLHRDFTCRLVHTGEVFDREQWVRLLNADYPGFEGMHVEDLVVDGDRGVLRAGDREGRRGRAARSPWPASRPCATASSHQARRGLGQRRPAGTREGTRP